MSRLLSKPRGDFEAALRSDEPVLALRSEVEKLLRGGMERSALLGLLSEYRETLQEQAREQDEDVVLDVMDFLTGWSAPGIKL